MRVATLGILLPAAALCSCVSTPVPDRQFHTPTPGFRCTVRLAERTESVVVLNADGSGVSSQWEWNWRGDWQSGLGLWVTQSTGPDVNPNSVPVAVISSNPIRRDRKQTKRARLALTNLPGTDWLNFHYAIAKSEVPRGAGPSTSLWIGWSDLVAYVEGSPALYLLTLDGRDNTVTSQPIPRSVILNAGRDIKAMAERMKAKVADFTKQCDALEDIDPPNEIIVT